MLLNQTRKILRQVWLKSRMRAIAKAPQHVLNTIRSVIENKEEAFAEPFKFMPHHALALGNDEFALVKVSALVEPAIVEAIVVFGHAKRRKQADRAAEIFGVRTG